MNILPELFIEICKQLTLKDLLVLKRCNKSLYYNSIGEYTDIFVNLIYEQKMKFLIDFLRELFNIYDSSYEYYYSADMGVDCDYIMEKTRRLLLKAGFYDHELYNDPTLDYNDDSCYEIAFSKHKDILHKLEYIYNYDMTIRMENLNKLK